MKKFLLLFIGLMTVFCTKADIKEDFSTATWIPTAEAEAAQFTSTTSGIVYTMQYCKKGTYNKVSYLQISGKNYTGAYIQFALPEGTKSIIIHTGASASTNVTVTTTLGGTVISENLKLSAKNADFTINIPAGKENSKEVCKIEVSNKYNAQFSSLTFSTTGGGTVTPPEPVVVDNIKALIDLNNTADEITFNGEMTVVYAQAPSATSGINLYVKDNTGWLLLYGKTDNTYKNGDVIPAGTKGTYTLYGNDVPELKFTELAASSKSVAEIEPETVLAGDINAEPINSYVEVRGATISAVSGKNATISDDSGSFPIYNSLNIALIEGSNLTVRGFNSSFSGKGQFVPCEILSGSGREIVATPTFSVASGEVTEGTLVEIKCATEGATIYYTLDGTTPNADSDSYENAIAITSDVTVNAIAVKDGMDDSAMATATYTIKVVSDKEVTFDFTKPAELTPSFTEGTEVDGNNKYINTDEVVFTAKGVSLTNVGSQKYMSGETEKTSTCGRLYFQSSGAVQLRVYNYGILTISAPAGNKITKIEFAFNNTNGANLNGGENQVTVSGKNGTFSPAAPAESVAFKAKGSVQINQVTVFCENTLSGVEGIIAGEEDTDAPAEYYNLNGVRVNNPSTGLYIVRKGSKVSKVIIR